MRESGTVLGTGAGVATVSVGMVASANAQLAVPMLFVCGVWWWTIGKMWTETGMLPRTLGLATMGLAVVALGTAFASVLMTFDTATLGISERLVLGLWSLTLAFALWRSR